MLVSVPLPSHPIPVAVTKPSPLANLLAQQQTNSPAASLGSLINAQDPSPNTTTAFAPYRTRSRATGRRPLQPGPSLRKLHARLSPFALPRPTRFPPAVELNPMCQIPPSPLKGQEGKREKAT